MLTCDELKSKMTYDPETGIFIRFKGKGAGSPAGRLHKVRGYREICINHKLYYAHRLAWLYMTGEWPKNVIDHIDKDKANNAWSNLRDVSVVVNGQNRKGAQSNSRTGILGVSGNGSGFRARIFEDGKEIYLGTFKTKGEAKVAHLAAVKKFRPDQPGESL